MRTVGVVTGVGITSGLSDPIFAVAACMAMVVMYVSFSLKYSALCVVLVPSMVMMMMMNSVCATMSLSCMCFAYENSHARLVFATYVRTFESMCVCVSCVFVFAMHPRV